MRTGPSCTRTWWRGARTAGIVWERYCKVQSSRLHRSYRRNATQQRTAELGEAKVHDADVARAPRLTEEEVLRLEVPVHHLRGTPPSANACSRTPPSPRVRELASGDLLTIVASIHQTEERLNAGLE